MQSHVNTGPCAIHVPFTHGSLKHGLTSVSHLEPVLPIGHSQEYPKDVSVQVPPASHGSVVQILWSHRRPVMKWIYDKTFQ